MKTVANNVATQPLDNSLAAIPSLDRTHFAYESCVSPTGIELRALVPADEVYRCEDAQAPALLLIPGLGVDGLSFVRQLPLGSISALHFFQMPNEGYAGEAGLQQHARFVEEYIQAQKLDERPGGLILGGASMGGAVSLAVAIRGRVKVRGLVLIGTFGSCRQLPWIQRTLAPLAYVVPMSFLRRCAWLLAGRARIHSATRDEGRWMARPLLPRTMTYFGRAVMALTRQEQIEAARAVSIPALVIHGSKDAVLPPSAGKELAQALQRARLIEVEGARHSLFFSHPAVVNAAIAEFIRDLRAGRMEQHPL